MINLTEREIEVLKRYVAGYSHKEIAAALHISPYTVHNHLARIRAKAPTDRLREALVMAAKENLI